VVDSSTDLFNAVFIEAMIGQEANRAMRYRRPLSVLVVEVDHADNIRQELAPDQLARLLAELGHALVEAVRDTDTAGFLDARHSPLFAVVLPEADAPSAIQAADNLRRSISSRDFLDRGPWQRLTVSVGAATLNHERMGQQQLLKEAHSALLSGRELGPNRTFATASV